METLCALCGRPRSAHGFSIPGPFIEPLAPTELEADALDQLERDEQARARSGAGIADGAAAMREHRVVED
jgi:hypothetical protein